jgi:hypothetical protein
LTPAVKRIRPQLVHADDAMIIVEPSVNASGEVGGIAVKSTSGYRWHQKKFDCVSGKHFRVASWFSGFNPYQGTRK